MDDDRSRAERIVSPRYEHEAIAEYVMVPRAEHERVRAGEQRADALLEAGRSIADLLRSWWVIVGDLVEDGDPGSHVGRLEARDFRELFKRLDAWDRAAGDPREPISHAEFARFVQEATEQRERADALAVALARSCEAVAWLLDEDWPKDMDPGPHDDPGPGIRTDLARWRALLGGTAGQGGES